MTYVLSLILISTFGLALQTCGSSETVSKAETVKTSANATTAANEAASNHASDEAPRISLADAKKDFDAGEAVFVDTRGADFYKTEHIKGAINVMVSDFEAKYKNIPNDKKIIAYCS